MPATDLKSIIDAWQLVLEAPPVSLVMASQAFSHDRQPNANMQDTYWIDDGGPVSRRSCTNFQEVRIDRLIVMVAKPVSFAGQAQFETMEQLGDTIYRQLCADGRTNGWNVEAANRRITNPPDTELIIASFGFTVDYDFSSAVA
jgi:hypothetical protein